ncbi:MAG: hypothetical protein C0469_07460, partial [Cyanobacteria bacterium DS2.3.42]|nr:hypothetical protein [Cyanobacteria bacterium DS2.3.42]
KKLQELAAKTQATTMIMPPTAPQSGGLASPQVITFLNQQQQVAANPSLLSQLGSQMRPGELPPALSLPTPTGSAAAAAAAATATAATTALPTDTQVNSLSGFLGQLRGFQQSEKGRLQKQEDNTRKMLGYSSSDSGSGGSSLNLPPLPPLPALPPLPSGLTTETPVTAGAALSAAAQALPQLMSGGFKSMSGPDVSSATSAMPAIAPPPSLVPTAPAPGPNHGLHQAYQRIGSLEEQNRQLSAQLAQANNVLKTSAPPVSPVPNSAQDLMPAPMSAPLQSPQPDLLPPISPVPQAAPDFSRNKAQSVSTVSSKSPGLLIGMPSLPTAANTKGTVRFELEGVVPSRSQIKLKVVLKNDRDFPMELPPTVSAKIQMPGKPEQYAKVEFTGKQINAHGEIHGIIKVPGKDLNASADVSLPNFLPPSEQYRDVHLTVPISKL